MRPFGHKRVQFGQENDTLLLVRIGAGQDGDGLALAGVDRQMGNTGGDVDQITGIGFHLVFKGMAPVHDRRPLDHIDRGLVLGMKMGLGPATRRNAQHVHANGSGAGCLARDPLKIIEPLLAGIGFAKAEFLAGIWHLIGHRSGVSNRIMTL